MSIMEISHRSKPYEEVNERAAMLLRELLGLGSDYHVLFLGGGASTQFAMIPMNFLPKDGFAGYADTGEWAARAIKEAGRFGRVEVVASSKEKNYTFIPKMSCPPGAAYLHVTSNNTIFGTQMHAFPETGNVPLVSDMSSDICSRRVDAKKFALIYAGAQKNLGPSGVTVVILKDEFLAKAREGNPTMLDYRTHAKNQSLYNTPPVFAVYVMDLVLQWIKAQGGLAAVEEVNRAKQKAIYDLIDAQPDYFRGTAERESRSWMNLTLRLPNEDLEKKFVSEAEKAGFIGLKGHRSVGGIRVSLYNALPLEGAQKLAEFMKAFKARN
jgi:phosphoserine aminotransferase